MIGEFKIQAFANKALFEVRVIVHDKIAFKKECKSAAEVSDIYGKLFDVINDNLK